MDILVTGVGRVTSQESHLDFLAMYWFSIISEKAGHHVFLEVIVSKTHEDIEIHLPTFTFPIHSSQVERRTLSSSLLRYSRVVYWEMNNKVSHHEAHCIPETENIVKPQ